MIDQKQYTFMSNSVSNKTITIWIRFRRDIVKKAGQTAYFDDFTAINGPKRHQILSMTQYY